MAPTELALPKMDFDSTLLRTSKIDREEIVTPVAATRHACLDILGTDTVTVDLGATEHILGSAPTCDLQLAGEGVSREHARIVQRNDDFVIEDLSSTNGTFVNSVRIVECVLHHTDLVQVGATRLMFVEEQRRDV
jgi:hypothetical protein